MPRQYTRVPLADRFWPKVDKYGPVPSHRPELGQCWLWTAGRNRQGYGKVWVDGETIPAHRAAYELTHGSLPDDLWVLHECDNPPCVNPAHLFTGDAAANMRDRDQKGRTARGDASGLRLHPERAARGSRNGHATRPERTPRGAMVNTAKVTEADVLAIRARLAAGSTTRQLATEYGVRIELIGRIARRETWHHVT
jgi:hypothetical protein